MGDLIVVHDAANGDPILLNRDAIASAAETRHGGQHHSTTVELTNGNQITVKETIDEIAP